MEVLVPGKDYPASDGILTMFVEVLREYLESGVSGVRKQCSR